MAAFTHTLVFSAASLAEYNSMKLYITAMSTTGQLKDYAVTWKDSQRTLTLVSTGTRLMPWIM